MEEGHFSLGFVVGSDLEGNDLNSVEHVLQVHKDLLSVPHIVEVTAFGVRNTSGVTSRDEVSDSAADSGRGVPQDLGGATVVHGRGPHGEDDVLGVEGSIVKESLMLGHAGVKGDIVILAPATERVEEKDRVLVSLLDELFTGVLKEENVSIMEGVADLEGVDGISILLFDGG